MPTTTCTMARGIHGKCENMAMGCFCKRMSVFLRLNSVRNCAVIFVWFVNLFMPERQTHRSYGSNENLLITLFLKQERKN